MARCCWRYLAGNGLRRSGLRHPRHPATIEPVAAVAMPFRWTYLQPDVMGTGSETLNSRLSMIRFIGAKPLPRLRFAGRTMAALALAALLANCGEGQKQAGAPPPPAVTVAKPIKRTLFDFDEYVGRFTAVNSVEVRARVSGYLDSVDFKDGQIVKKGDLLFTIDKRPFQNSVDQARANLQQAQSNAVYTKADLDRGQQLVRDKTITDQTYEQRAQAFRNAQASVGANEAAVRQAELDVEFTELRAPIAGRIGDRRVSP